MKIKTALKVTGAAHLVLTGLRTIAAGGDAPVTTKFLYFLMLGDTPDVNLTTAVEEPAQA